MLALPVTCAMAILFLLALSRAGAAEVAGYGELTRFGEVSAGGKRPRKGSLSEARTLALGVDPKEENSVFVLEESKREEVVGATTKRFFRLKKFKVGAKGKYAESASVDFQQTSPHLTGEARQRESLKHQKPGVQGLVVDAEKDLVYLLATDLRGEAARSTRPKKKGKDVSRRIHPVRVQHQRTGGSARSRRGDQPGSPGRGSRPRSSVQHPRQGIARTSGDHPRPSHPRADPARPRHQQGVAEDDIAAANDHYVSAARQRQRGTRGPVHGLDEQIQRKVRELRTHADLAGGGAGARRQRRRRARVRQLRRPRRSAATSPPANLPGSCHSRKPSTGHVRTDRARPAWPSHAENRTGIS